MMVRWSARAATGSMKSGRRRPTACGLPRINCDPSVRDRTDWLFYERLISISDLPKMKSQLDISSCTQLIAVEHGCPQCWTLQTVQFDGKITHSAAFRSPLLVSSPGSANSNLTNRVQVSRTLSVDGLHWLSLSDLMLPPAQRGGGPANNRGHCSRSRAQ